MQTGSAVGRVANMPAGPELAAVLAGVDLAGVPNGRLVEVLRAQARQLAHEQARLLACLVEVGRADPGDLDGGAAAAGDGPVGEWGDRGRSDVDRCGG